MCVVGARCRRALSCAAAAALFCGLAWAGGGALSDARSLIRSGEFAGALRILRRLDAADSVGADAAEIRFFRGLAAVAAAERAGDEEEGEALLGEAAAAFHSVLVARPGFLRARAELGYVLFLQGKDDLARGHFETTLAGNPPPPLAANARRILAKIRARDRGSGYFSVGVERSDNINGGSDADVVYLFGLPFRVDEESRPQSATGLALAGGGEYQHLPGGGGGWRWRFGADFARGEYAGGDFDQSYAAVRSGPRVIFARRRGEASLQAVVGRRWSRKRRSDEFGLRLDIRRRIGERAGIDARVRRDKTRERNSVFADAVSADYFAGADWLFTPLLQGNVGVGFAENRPDGGGRWRELRARAGLGAILGEGWTIGGEGEWRRRRFAENAAFSAARREDRARILRLFALNRGLLFFGFSPRISLSRELQDSNSVFAARRRTRAGLRFVRQL